MSRPRSAVTLGFLAVSLALSLSPLAAGKGNDPTRNPFLKVTNPTTWDTRREVDVFRAKFTDRYPGGTRQTVTSRIVLNQMTVVAPMITGCASASIDPDRLKAVLKVDHHTVVDKPTIVPGYPDGEQLARWDAHDIDTDRFSVVITGPATTFDVSVDEKAALRVPWPKSDYPEEIASSLEPQRFVESDAKNIIRLMNKWTSNNPHGPNPYLVAKALAGQVQQSFQPSGTQIRTNQPVRFAGLNVEGASIAADRMRGTESDMAALLCAVYRAAGIPARVVIGWDIAGSPGGRANVPAPNEVCRANFDPDIARIARMRTWVEFYLYDEANNRGGWIPVDILMLRLSSSRMQRIDRPWDGFGGGMCFDHLIPVTFHFVPPSTVDENSAPAFWGWIPLPTEPAVDVELIFEATPAVKRGRHR